MSALDVQVGGDHYKKLKIQPVEYMHANGIPFIEGCIIKYASRWRDKGGIADLEKIKHFAQLLIDLEEAEAASEQCKPAAESNKNNQDHPSWLSAPKWAEWLAQNESGRWCWYEKKPLAVPAETSDDVGEWDIASTEDEFENSVMGMPNQYWYSTLVSRPQQ